MPLTSFNAYNPDQPDLSALTSRVTIIELGQVPAIPFTVQDGGANPLSSYSTANLKPGVIVGVSDMGGCGPAGANGFGLACWNGSAWYRLSRGTQATLAPAATITLDYWKSPQLVSLSGATAVTTRILVANAPNGARYSITKPGITSLLAAYSINVASGTPATDISMVGPNPGLFEIAAGVLNQVYTY